MLEQKQKTGIEVIRYLEDNEENFPIRYFFNRLEKLEYAGKNQMSDNIAMTAFDAGLRMGLLWQKLIGPNLDEFNRQAKEIAEEELSSLPALAKEWNENGFFLIDIWG
ncbi:MAG: hypothetical protein AB1633_05810 [Elusimicrobiota bacterium]